MILVTCVSLSIKFFLLDRLSTFSSWLSAHLLENLFKKMFVDSKIAGGFSMAKDKLSYLISFGLFPYYSCQLSQNVQKCKRFVLFDESFNDILNREQMDISVKFFCEDRQMAVTRYWSWEFLQKPTANDIERHLRSSIQELQLNWLFSWRIQILSFWEILKLKDQLKFLMLINFWTLASATCMCCMVPFDLV